MVHLPAMTFCGSILELADWSDEKLRSECAKITGLQTCMNETADKISSYVSSNVRLDDKLDATFKLIDSFTISELMHGTHEPGKLFMAHLRINSETQAADQFYGLTDTFETSNYLNRVFSCVTLKWKAPYDKIPYATLQRQITSVGMFAFLVRSDFLISIMSQVSVAYSPNERKLITSDMLILPGGKGICTSFYDLFKGTLLPAPFWTDCINYSDYGFENKAHCYETCYTTACIDRFNRTPLSSRMDETYGNLYGMSEKFVNEHYQTLNMLSNECDQKCKWLDCQQVIYSTRMKSSDKDDAVTLSGHVSYLPTSPIVIVECMQKLTFAEFATDLCSTFGFWLGLSVISVVTWMQELVVKVMRTHKSFTA
jgi:hypothetical protein